MNLIIKSDVVNVLNISNEILIKEITKIDCQSKAIAINHYDGETFGILEENDVLSIFDLFGDVKLKRQLNSSVNSFSIYKNDLILAGDSLGSFHQYDFLKNSKIIKNQINDNPITLINALNGRNILYFLHKNGTISYYKVKEQKSDILKYNISVSTFDVNHWFHKLLLLGSSCGNLETFDIEKERTVSSWSHHTQGVNSVAFSPSNKHIGLSVSKDRTVTVIGVDKNNIINSYNLSNEPLSCAFGENFNFAVGDDAGIVSIFDFRTHKVIEKYETLGKVTFVGFNYTYRKNDRSNYSEKSRVLKDLQNISDNNSISNHSLFSIDGSLGTKEEENSYDMSELVCENSSIGLSSLSIKKDRKQVKFKVNNCKKNNSKSKLANPSIEPIILEDVQELSNISTKISSNENTTLDNVSLRRIIADELKRELTNFEFRIKNDLIFGIVDQLSITENNIVLPITALLEDNKALINENEILRQELRKYKYNV